jgi:phage portal protein BeeE
MAANEYRQLSQNRLVVNHRLVFPVIQMISKSRAFFPCYKTQEKSIKVKRIDHQEMTSLTRLNVGIRLVFYILNVFQTQ